MRGSLQSALAEEESSQRWREEGGGAKAAEEIMLEKGKRGLFMEPCAESCLVRWNRGTPSNLIQSNPIHQLLILFC
ncbi:hypothetical protein FCM35_KLT09370 [Carex littledalei]|uniref:Uncharacterized protein n=1 Tax=Carex littledalei TaxID=544730 RepID=A0A833VJR3_9POAL|nr:hypothetical protein FCM35_KLT09370 [Carex littledalei]